MAKRKIRDEDSIRTSLLNQPELYVQKGKGGPDYFVVWNNDPWVDFCPLCRATPVRMQDLFQKTYYDVISSGGTPRLVTLEYNFYKYRCPNEACRHIFAKEISFASRDENITSRFKKEIAREVISGESFSIIAKHFSDAVTRQAVGQIFQRWVHEKEAVHQIASPSSLAVFTGHTDKDSYTVYLNLDEPDNIRVLDIQYGVSSQAITARLRSLGLRNIHTVLTDCNPIVCDVVNDNLPDALYIIPVECWQAQVEEDFLDYATEELKHSPQRSRKDLLLRLESEMGKEVWNFDQLLRSRPQLQQPYLDYQELRTLIRSRETLWTYKAISGWANAVCEDLRSALDTSFLKLDLYKDAIYRHELHRGTVPPQLCAKAGELEAEIKKFRTFSDEVLKARVFYSTEDYINNPQGIPIDIVIQNLKNIKIYRKPEEE